MSRGGGGGGGFSSGAGRQGFFAYPDGGGGGDDFYFAGEDVDVDGLEPGAPGATFGRGGGGHGGGGGRGRGPFYGPGWWGGGGWGWGLPYDGYFDDPEIIMPVSTDVPGAPPVLVATRRAPWRMLG